MGSQKFSSPSEQHLERIALEFGSQESERDTTMKTTTKNTGIKVNAGVKAGGVCPGPNHNRSGLKVASGIKAGDVLRAPNHNARMIAVSQTAAKSTAIKVSTGVKVGGVCPGPNHNRSGLKVASGIKAGDVVRVSNHNARMIAAA